MNNDKAVITFADGAGHYAKAMMRLQNSLSITGFDGDFLGFSDYIAIGSPLHKNDPNAVPYAFKAFSIKKAINEGYRQLLWCDSVIYATKSIDPIFSHIKENGYLFFDNIGFSIGDYTSDACLEKHGMSRQDAFESPMIMACVMGFDFESSEAMEFLVRYIAAASDGVSYPGNSELTAYNASKSWTNENLQVSNDMRVKGHRHDQSVASIIIKQMGLKITNAQQTFFAYHSHKGILPIAKSVCLWSGGL